MIIKQIKKKNMSPVIANPIPKKGEKKKKKTFLEIIKFPNTDFNLASVDPQRAFTVSANYKLLDTVEILRWFHKRYQIKNVLAGQPDTRYDVNKFKNDSNYKKEIINKRRSKQHFVRISDAEPGHESKMEILILNSHNKRSKLRIIMSLTNMISSEFTTFVSVKAIYGYAEFKHEDVAERTLNSVLEEFWTKERTAAYALQQKMSNIVPEVSLLELCQQLASIKITKKSPVLSAQDILDTVVKNYKVITYDALYQTAIQYIRAKNMVRYVSAEKGSIWGLQKEIKIAIAVLDVFKKHLSVGRQGIVLGWYILLPGFSGGSFFW